ncbi:MAG: hypothetical protein ILM98_09200 [Kiritimatiellae bacterium]|nr:hypothetical protein [Kiritimatiellia bacterium]
MKVANSQWPIKSQGGQTKVVRKNFQGKVVRKMEAEARANGETTQKNKMETTQKMKSGTTQKNRGGK